MIVESVLVFFFCFSKTKMLYSIHKADVFTHIAELANSNDSAVSISDTKPSSAMTSPPSIPAIDSVVGSTAIFLMV